MSTSFARALAWLGVAALAAAAWLLWPSRSLALASSRALRVCLVDVSASVVRTRPDWREWVATALTREARAAESARESMLVVAFARDVLRCFGPGSAGEFDVTRCLSQVRNLRDDASELDEALAAVAESPEARAEVLKLRLLSDRTYTSSDPTPRLADLAARGAQIEWIRPPAERADLALIALRAPDELEVGAPLSVVAELAFASDGKPTASVVDVEVEARGATVAHRTVRAPLSDSDTTPVRIDLGPVSDGVTFLRAAARLDGGDPVPENDSASAIVRTRGALGVAFVGDGEALETARAWAASAESVPGLSVIAGPSSAVAEMLATSDCIVTFDVDPRRLPRALVVDFLRRGGGWLACGGYEFLAGWSAVGDADLASRLPLEVDDDATPRDVLLLVDDSGSMSDDAFGQVRRAAPTLIAMARRNDRVALHFFTDRLESALELGNGGDDRDATTRKLLEARVPGGPTDIARALDELCVERERASKAALVLLLTDGRDQQARAAQVGELRSRLAAARAELVVIAVGPSADVAYLSSLAGDASRVLHANDEPAFRAIFERELARGRVRDDAPIELSVARPTTSSSNVADDLRAGFAVRSLPPLDRCIRARARAGDEVLLATAAGEPVLALRREGVGFAATWTSWPHAEWGNAWRDELPRLAPVLRALARTHASEPSTVAHIEGLELVLEHVPIDWPAELECTVRELERNAEPIARARLVPPASSAGLDPRTLRVGSWLPERTPESSVCELSLTGRGDWAATLPCMLPTPAEFSPPRRTVGPLAAAASSTNSPSRRRAHTAGAWLLALGLIALGTGAALGSIAPSLQAERRSRR